MSSPKLLNHSTHQHGCSTCKNAARDVIREWLAVLQRDRLDPPRNGRQASRRKIDAGGDSRADADIVSFLFENANGVSNSHRLLDHPETIKNAEIRLLSAHE